MEREGGDPVLMASSGQWPAVALEAVEDMVCYLVTTPRSLELTLPLTLSLSLTLTLTRCARTTVRSSPSKLTSRCTTW